MNVMLTRLPDGTVNAEPGDAVEFVYGSEWRPAIYRGLLPQNTNTIDIAVLRLPGADNDFPTALAHVRHARGGAGHLRLQVARLRAFIDKEFGATERFEELTEGDYKRGVNAMAHINKVAAENAATYRAAPKYKN